MKKFFLLCLAAVLASSTCSNLFAQEGSGNVNSSVILDLKRSQEELVQLANVHHAEPMAKVTNALTEKLPNLETLREKLSADPENRRLQAEFDNGLAQVLTDIDAGLESFADGEAEVLTAVNRNIDLARRGNERIAKELKDIASKREQLGPQLNEREKALRAIQSIYGVDDVPDDIVAQSEKLRADIKTIQRVSKTLEATESEKKRLAHSLKAFQSDLESRLRKLEVTYHAVAGHRTVILHLVEYRSTRAERVKTEAEIKAFNEQLERLLRSVADTDFGDLIEIGLDR